jgi:cholesterol transport system auxiliary component
MLASPSSLHSVLHAARNIFRASQNPAGRRRRRFHAVACAAFSLLVAAIVSSCGSPKPIRFYQLTPPPLPPVSNVEPYPVTIILGAMTASHIYREDRIVYGLENEGMGLYEYQRWAEPPTEMIQEMLLRELRASHRFSEVYLLRSSVRGDYLLRGRLYDFKEVSGASVLARVTFELELRDNKTGKTVWNKYYHQDEPVTGKDAASVVAALDKNISRGTTEACAGIEQYFADHPPQPADTPPNGGK